MESPPRTSRAKNSPAREALGSIPWLAEVSEPTLDALAAHAMLHRLPAGSMAFEQAETPAFAMFLVSGSLTAGCPRTNGSGDRCRAAVRFRSRRRRHRGPAISAPRASLRGRAASADRRGPLPGRHGFRQRPLSRGAWVRRHAVAPTVAGREELSPPLGRGRGRGLHPRPDPAKRGCSGTRLLAATKRAKSLRISA